MSEVTREQGTAVEQQRAYNVVGTSPGHHDFVDKVRGTLLYAADWKLPGMLFGKVVRSEMASARVKSIDVSEARRLDGVITVLTAEDVPHNAIVEHASGGLGELTVEQPVLAQDVVRYVGEPLAVIAAVDQETADEAADLVQIEYEPVAGVYSAAEALADDAPLVHDAGNVLVSWRLERGDVEQAFARPTSWSRTSTRPSTSSTPTWRPRPASVDRERRGHPAGLHAGDRARRRRSPRSSSCRRTGYASSRRTWAVGSAARRT